MVTSGSPLSYSLSSSGGMEMISIGGLPESDLDDTGVSMTVSSRDISSSAPSTLICISSAVLAGGFPAGSPFLGAGEGGEDGMASSDRDVFRTLIVTRLDRGPEGGSAGAPGGCCGSGVEGIA